MAKWKSGDRVRVVTRAVTEEDRKNSTYFEHMAGLTGIVEYIYDQNLISVKVDPTALGKVSAEVHKEASSRMRIRMNEALSEDGKKMLTSEDLNFPVNFNLLVSANDLEPAK